MTLAESIRARYADSLMPWYLRWALPPERPMLLIVGRRGAGKTALATKIAVNRMRQGERVYANYAIHDRGRHAGRVFSLLQCMDLGDCTIVIDEANMWCNSRSWAMIPDGVIAEWQESRKSGVSFIFTSQHESRVDVIIRELVDWVLCCERVPLVPKWVPFFRYHRTYLEEIEQVRAGTVGRAVSWWMGDDIMRAYATRERIGTFNAQVLREYAAALKAGDEGALARLADSVPRIEPWDDTPSVVEAAIDAV